MKNMSNDLDLDDFFTSLHDYINLYSKRYNYLYKLKKDIKCCHNQYLHLIIRNIISIPVRISIISYHIYTGMDKLGLGWGLGMGVVWGYDWAYERVFL